MIVLTKTNYSCGDMVRIENCQLKMLSDVVSFKRSVSK